MKINLSTPINQLGYGIAGLNICKELSEITDLSLFPIGPIQITNRNDAEKIKPCLISAQMLDFHSPSIKIWHQHDMSQFPGKGIRIGFPFFELDTFSDIEKHHLNSVDYIFVCSEWAKNICSRNLTIDDDRIMVVPLGVDQDIFKPCTAVDSDKTIFFNCGKWEIRKGHDALVKIFNTAFDEKDNVELWLMCSNPFLSVEESSEWESLYKNSKLGEKIKIIPRADTQEEVYNIMSHIDCGIFPSRAEGWNLELLELMSCGKHVIATNVSAHTEFCKSSNARLVDVLEQENAYDGKWFFGNGKWAKITKNNIREFADLVRNVHEEKMFSKLGTNQEGIKTAKDFSWKNTARKIYQHVQHIQK